MLKRWSLAGIEPWQVAKESGLMWLGMPGRMKEIQLGADQRENSADSFPQFVGAMRLLSDSDPLQGAGWQYGLRIQEHPAGDVRNLMCQPLHYQLGNVKFCLIALQERIELRNWPLNSTWISCPFHIQSHLCNFAATLQPGGPTPHPDHPWDWNRSPVPLTPGPPTPKRTPKSWQFQRGL